jgi:type I restriction enzyme R subunit
MANDRFTESVVEEAALEWFAAVGYSIVHGPSIAPGEPAAERSTYGQAFLANRLLAALHHLNPDAADAAIDEAFRRLTTITSPNLIDANHAFHTSW